MNKYRAQAKYQKEKMKQIKFCYKSEFVSDYRIACKALDITMSDQMREVMQSTIKLAKDTKPVQFYATKESKKDTEKSL